MTDQHSDDDQWMLDLTRAMYEAVDPAPETLVLPDFPYIRWSAPDADIGVLFDDLETVAVRRSDAIADNPAFRFDNGMIVKIDLESLSGEVAPWQGGVAWIEHVSGGRVDIDVDDHGEFMIGDVPRGNARLWLRTPDGDFVTGSFLVIRGRSS